MLLIAQMRILAHSNRLEMGGVIPMNIELTLTFAKKFLERLTRPSAVLVGSEHQQKARLLASLSLALVIAIAVIAPIWAIFMPSFTAAPYLALGTLGAMALTYGVSRTRLYGLGALILISTIWGWVWLAIFMAPGPLPDRMLVLNFLVLAVMVADLFLERRMTLLVVALSFASIVVFFFVPTVPFTLTYSYVAFFLLVSILGTISSALQQHYKQRLAESEMLHRSLVAALSEGIVLHMGDGSVQACNTAAERILGLTAEQMMGRTPIDPHWYTIHEDGTPFLDQTHPAMTTLYTGHAVENVMMGVHQPNGDLRWVSINSQPLIFAGERVPYAVVTSFTDITKQKWREEALFTAQQRYRALFDQAHDAVFLLDLDGWHLEANERAAQMLGYTVAEIQHLSFRDLSAEQSQSTQVLERLLAGERFPVYERLFRHKDGSLIPVEINVELIRDGDGSPLHVQSVVRDIRERKLAEEALRQSEERYKGVVDTQTELICRYLPDATLVFVNDAYCRYYGYSRQELIGRSFLSLIPPAHQAEARQHYLSLLQNPRTEQYEHMEVTSKGETRWQEWVERVLVDDEGQPIEIQVVGRDVTEHKLAQQREFELTLEKERVQLLTDFIQNAAHEFRTPLAIIGTNAFVLARLEDAQKRQDRVAIINEQIERMVRLIEILLLMARLKSKAEMKANLSAVHMGVLAESIAKSKEAKYGSQPALHYEKPATLPLLMGDLDSLREAVNQILDNAYRYTPAEGSITITIHYNEEQICMVVKDTGMGIAKEHFPYIFQTFWRQDMAHTTPGFGLGLAIAQRIVEAHGGRIEVTSQIGFGSTFTMILPRRSW